MMSHSGGGAALGIGTATFITDYGIGRASQRPGAALVRAAVQRGVRYLDTAASYGAGEAAIGAVADLVVAHNVRVCTKVEVDPGAMTSASFEAAVRASLARLRLESVDTLLLHSAPARTIAAPAVAEACRAVRRAGVARRVGASTYGDAALTALDADWCDVVQIEFSILNPEVLRAAAARRRPGQEIVARSVLCKGLLTRRWREAPQVAAAAVAPALEGLERLAGRWGYELPELAIRFALDTPGLDVVLVGVGSADELDVALRARDRARLAPEQMTALAAFDRSALDAAHPERWDRVSTS
jgi:aryl-alcohol dehydrogenase-like predicted oxidoreductase